MLIRLAEIIDEPFRWAETRSFAAASLESDQLVGLGPISWSGEVTQAATGHLLVGRLGYEQQLACPRCLKPTTIVVEAEVELLIQPRSSEPTLGEVELEEEDLSILYVDGDELDIEPILREQLQLNVPMRQLCREDCRGLCPICGGDRNDEACDCEERQVDPRWEVLRNFGRGKH
ncbi:MAG: DUF177 domain-containing protein [Acidobacteriota bacterium]|nr:DUF177 domain-containing protein [Acidobacteriota bacterium]